MAHFERLGEDYRALREPMEVLELRLTIIQLQLRNKGKDAGLERWKTVALDLDAENEKLQAEVERLTAKDQCHLEDKKKLAKKVQNLVRERQELLELLDPNYWATGRVL